MCSVSLWGCLIPDSLLLDVFEHLGIQTLGTAACVCRTWRRVAHDDLLWQRLARRTWSISGQISPGRHSWREEAKRLVHHVPSVPSEVYEGAHTDEVLDVTVSHRGEYFCTTSKDAAVILWRLGCPCTQIVMVNTAAMFSWTLTQYSQFNEPDTLVLVCGVKLSAEPGHFNMLGYTAVFSVPELAPMYVVPMDPPTLRGAWLTDDIFVGGDMKGMGIQGTVKIQAHQVPKEPLILPDDPDTIVHCNPVTLFNFQGHKHHQMSLFVATIPLGREVTPPSGLVSNTTSVSSTAVYEVKGNQPSDECLVSHTRTSMPDLGQIKCQTFHSDTKLTTSKKHVKHENTPERRLNIDTAHILKKSDTKVDPDCLANFGSVGHSVLESAHGDRSGVSCSGKTATCANCNRVFPEPGELRGVADSGSSVACDKMDESESNTTTVTEGKHIGALVVTDNDSEIQVKKYKSDKQSTISDCASKSSVYQTGARTLEADDSIQSILCSMLDNSPCSTSSTSAVKRETSDKRCILFVTGVHDAIAAHEISDEKLASVVEDLEADSMQEENVDENGRPRLHTKDHYFFFKNVYITGLCLSHDHRLAYFNYRELDRTIDGQENDSSSDEENPERDVSHKTFCDSLKVGVLDLVTMTHVKDVVYTGHMGCSSYPAWYICLGASPDYIGSGSEDACGYLWDRHYGMNITRLQHQHGVVNGIAFNPVDQEVCVSVCDDQSIIVWRSFNRLHETRLRNMMELERKMM